MNKSFLTWLIDELRAAIKANPDCALHWVVIPREGQLISRGYAATADLASAFEAMCDDVEAMHVYGECGHCDRIAMSFRAARTTFRQTFGANQQQECTH